MLGYDPNDANPMNRRVPAEVVARRSHKSKNVVDEVTVDLKTAGALKPDSRPKWLSKACKMAAEGRVTPSELYNVIVSRKFGGGLPDRIGRKLGLVVRANIKLFSEKQQRYLGTGDCPLMAHLISDEGATADGEVDDDHGEEAEDTAARTESMMAKCRAFVRQNVDSFEARQRESDENEQRKKVEVEEQVEVAQARADAAQRAERDRLRELRAEQAVKRKIADEAARELERKRKLEEEADHMLERAMLPQPVAASKLVAADRGHSRSISAPRSQGSCSVSSRRSRRKRDRSFDRVHKRDWHATVPTGGVVQGSRALFMNREFLDGPRSVLAKRPRSRRRGGRRQQHRRGDDSRSSGSTSGGGRR